MVAAISFDDLPPTWNSFDLEAFSRDKRLWGRQQDALRNALKALQRYYDEWPDYWDFINRMCFWMAKGSGKTLVLIKLIEILSQLMGLDETPTYDILVLAYRDDLIE